MGDQRSKDAGKNDFFSYTYDTLSARITINGVTGKMIDKKHSFRSEKPSLPAYRNTSDIYFSPGPDGKASQAKLYGRDGKMCLDFDWDHTHINKDGTIFPMGTVHVQAYVVTRIKNPRTRKWEDKFKRVRKARRMTLSEIEKFGPILRHFNPDIIF